MLLGNLMLLIYNETKFIGTFHWIRSIYIYIYMSRDRINVIKMTLKLKNEFLKLRGENTRLISLLDFYFDSV